MRALTKVEMAARLHRFVASRDCDCVPFAIAGRDKIDYRY
jgi:hypothetical protein